MESANSQGRIAVITGAGTGVGSVVAQKLAGAGHTVALVGRRAGKIEQIAHEIRSAGGKASAFKGDISNPDDVRNIFRRITDQLGVAGVLVNNAGVFGQVVPIAASDPADWIQTMRINVNGPYLMAREFVSAMVARGWGRIINVSSAAALHPPGGHSSAYQLSKVALNWFTRQLAAELNGTGVTVNAMHPGDLKTEMWASIKSQSEDEGNQGMLSWAKMVDQSGGDPPEKAAELILSLLKPESDSITGQFLWINDGIKKPMPSW
jgi:NAD(P)-dependent dehydrogenase (short-subunit alcohol dehydrogenase family)